MQYASLKDELEKIVGELTLTSEFPKRKTFKLDSEKQKITLHKYETYQVISIVTELPNDTVCNVHALTLRESNLIVVTSMDVSFSRKGNNKTHEGVLLDQLTFTCHTTGSNYSVGHHFTESSDPVIRKIADEFMKAIESASGITKELPLYQNTRRLLYKQVVLTPTLVEGFVKSLAKVLDNNTVKAIQLVAEHALFIDSKVVSSKPEAVVVKDKPASEIKKTAKQLAREAKAETEAEPNDGE